VNRIVSNAPVMAHFEAGRGVHAITVNVIGPYHYRNCSSADLLVRLYRLFRILFIIAATRESRECCFIRVDTALISDFEKIKSL